MNKPTCTHQKPGSDLQNLCVREGGKGERMEGGRGRRERINRSTMEEVERRNDGEKDREAGRGKVDCI